MSSTFGGLNTVVRGLYAQQLSLDTVGHNIANAGTDGFSRQRVNLATTSPTTLYGSNGTLQVGTGVTVQSVTRARDTFIDQQMWKESSSLGYGQAIQDTLGKIEGVFNDSSGTGIQSVLNEFWKAWNTLSTNASDNGARTALRERGVELADAIQHANTQLRDMVADINSVIEIKVDKINQITLEILSLNKQITSIETGKTDNANDLRDRRDYLVDQLSGLMNIRVNEDQAGNYIIQTSNTLLVSGTSVNKLATKSRLDPDYNYEVVDVVDSASGVVINFTGGEVKGLIESRDSVDSGAKGYLNKLASMSQFLLQEFNAVQRDGFGTDGSTNYNFFGISGNSSYTDYNNAANYNYLFGTDSPKSYQWIANLKVNDDLFDPAAGTAKIAAKTMVGSPVVDQSRPAGGKAVIGGDYTGITPPVDYQVKITAVADGVVTGVQYSTDGGSTWTAAATAYTPVAGPQKFYLGGMPNGITIQIAANSANTTGDTYTFTIPKDPQGNAAGDNAINLANRLKVDTSATIGNSSLDTFYSSFIGALGVQSENAKRLTDNQSTLVNQITNWRESVAGVNMDEEMTNMIRFQKGYNAAARVLTTMDEMLDKLINGTGVVGR